MPKNIQVFCFSYAGGTASFFDCIENDLPDYSLVKLEYSGHGSRYKEQLYHNFYELSEDLYNMIKSKYNGNDYALFGYSMGTISLVEVLRRIVEDDQMPLPCCVFLAAHEPHTKSELVGFQSDELDEWVKERTIKFGGVPDDLIENNSFWRVYLPLYRADYSLIGSYNFEELEFSAAIPATIFYSETDTRYEDMRDWENVFTGGIEYYSFVGNHFFINDHHTALAQIIKLQMDRSVIYDV